MTDTMRHLRLKKILAGCALAAGILIFAGCSPAPLHEPILLVEGNAGTKFTHVVTYIDHGEKTSRSKKETNAEIPESGKYVHKLDRGHDGVSVEVTLADAEAVALVELLDGDRTVYDLDVTAGDKKLILQGGQIHKPQPWSTFLGLTVIWGMTGVCLVGLVTVALALWRQFNAYQAKLARQNSQQRPQNS